MTVPMRRGVLASRLSSLLCRSAIAALAAIAPLLSACSLSPLNHRINVGQEPFIIFVGDGIDHHTDLFAAAAGGGTVAQVTFTPLVEQGPRLTPIGDVVAFLRMRDTLPGTRHDVVVMNLLSGSEVVLGLPAGSGQPERVAWSPDASNLYIRTDRGVWQSTAPPMRSAVMPVASSERADADSALELWLGQPRFARVVGCAAGGLCVVGPKGDTTALAPTGSDALRWGDDSVAWFENNGVTVRSLGPGRSRRVNWRNPPVHPRDGSYAAGAPIRSQ
jgi:hypothetical protein